MPDQKDNQRNSNTWSIILTIILIVVVFFIFLIPTFTKKREIKKKVTKQECTDSIVNGNKVTTCITTELENEHAEWESF